MVDRLQPVVACAEPVEHRPSASGIRPAGGSEHGVPMAGNFRVPFWTPGVRVLGVAALAGLAVLAARLLFGLGAVTHLNQQHPWGIWIGVDVATGVALAAGGFTTAFIAHVVHNDRYHSLVRPALLTAMLGYTFVGLGVAVDLGRYYNIWHVMMPSMWQGNSALFEVGMCVMCYLTVLYIEFLPLVCERFIGRVRLPGRLAVANGALDRLLRMLDRSLHRVMSVFIILGVVLSCAHQSSLGTLMVIAPTKLHPLWHTSVLPLLFLLSAFAVGLSMVVFESILASHSFKRPIEMPILESLARMIPFLLTVYLGAKLVDLVARDAYRFAFTLNIQSVLFGAELLVGVLLPIVILSSHRLRKTPGWLFTGAALVVIGVALNRTNVFLVGYLPPFADGPYIPKWTEVVLTLGFISLLVLLYRACVFVFPILPPEEGPDHAPITHA